MSNVQLKFQLKALFHKLYIACFIHILFIYLFSFLSLLKMDRNQKPDPVPLLFLAKYCQTNPSQFRFLSIIHGL